MGRFWLAPEIQALSPTGPMASCLWKNNRHSMQTKDHSLKIKKPELHEVKRLDQGHRARTRQSQDLNCHIWMILKSTFFACLQSRSHVEVLYEKST
ncbi:transcription termination factor 1, mitochondrial isoform X2 [Cebus imitator]|uniref:transcription termination factor 1, mitochondrial isoform X2 n=1 Tax=Cebus imitator TaxID=2715852 RepID=UPI0018973BCE|nr:transcription termination factor 1, mitochondrial isoform X2 [Cebus imitator]XP_037597242.1 transcription termination factor 1, mitochondrial isoform X2 [Cebus imitator]